jgi:Mg2+ and Co2+ transporter CorA
MDEAILLDLLASPKFFAPNNTSHRVIELFGDADAKETVVQDFNTTEKTFATIWRSGERRPANQQPLLMRLLVCNPRILDQDMWPLPMSAEALTMLLDELEIPSIFPRAICHHIPISASFDCPSSPSKTGLILRTNLSHTWQYAIAVVYDSSQNLTNAVLLGLKPPEIDEILESLSRLTSKDLACPVALPCILIDKCLDSVVKDVENRRRNLTQICQQLSSDGFHHPEISDDQLQWERDVVDLDRAMKILTGMSDVCAGISAVCMMQYSFIEVLSSFLSKWDPEGSNPQSRRMGNVLDTFKQLLRGIESKIVYSKTSVQGQIQTIYTLISQRESRSQVELAKISRRLAELTQNDSTHMRIIAGVTLVFLPATFMATFFSTTFFDFKPSKEDYVSRWIWLYCLLTICLTVAILGLWWYSLRSMRKKTKMALRRRSELKEKALRSDVEFSGTPTGLNMGMSRSHVPRP